jgi:uncharacterized protein YcfJ
MAGCEARPLNYREQGALGGAVLGAGTGAIIGSAVGNPAAGAAIGGGMGLLGGALVGNEMENERVRNDYMQAQLARQQQEIELNRRLMLEERPPVYESEVIRYETVPSYSYYYYP